MYITQSTQMCERPVCWPLPSQLLLLLRQTREKTHLCDHWKARSLVFRTHCIKAEERQLKCLCSMRFSIFIDPKQELLSTVILRQFLTSHSTAPFHFGITPRSDLMATVIISVVLPRDQRLGTDVSQIGGCVSGSILMPDPAHTAQRLLLTWCAGSACSCCLVQVLHDANCHCKPRCKYVAVG